MPTYNVRDWLLMMQTKYLFAMSPTEKSLPSVSLRFHLTGLLLIASRVMMIVFWALLSPDALDLIGANYSIGMGTLGLLFMIAAISIIKDEMAGEPGFHYAQAGVVFLIVGFSAVIVESFMMIVSSAIHV